MNKLNRLHRKYAFAILSLCGALALSACGGGGGGSAPPPQGPPPPPANVAPTADAGADQNASENSVVQLAGSGTDSDGGTLSYAWTQVSGPAGSFSAADTAAVEFAVPSIAVGATEDIVLRLTVSDGQGGSSSDDVTVTAASTDFILFIGRTDDMSPLNLSHYDPQTAMLTTLNDPLVVNGDVVNYTMSPDGEWVAYLADQETDEVLELYVAATDGSGVAKINAPFATGINGDVNQYFWSPDSSQIVYGADADLDGTTEIYRVDRDGGNHRKINGNTSNGRVTLTAPTWSPDGRYIFQLVRDPATNRTLGINIHDTQIGGFNSTRITNVPSTGTINQATWSPNSNLIAFISDSDSDDVFELYVVAPDGSGLQTLSAPLPAGGNIDRMQWSPNGSRLAYWGDQNVDGQIDLFVVNPDGTGRMQVNPALPADGDIFSPVWAPDSQTLAYRADDVDDGMYRLFTAAADGSNARAVSIPAIADGSVTLFRWAPDSQRLAYYGAIESLTEQELYAVNADGTSPAKLSVPVAANGLAFFSQGLALDPWSPDSGAVAYPVNAAASGNLDLYVVAPDGTGNTMVSRPPAMGGALATFPRWSADSSSVIYTSRQNDATILELFLASADGLTNLAISGPMTDSGFVTNFTWSP